MRYGPARANDVSDWWSMSARLKWTGHVLVDVGVAGICAFARKQSPEDVTLEDLDAVSEFLAETYYQEKLGTYLSCVFMNASFVQPKERREKKQRFYERYLRAHRAAPDPMVEGQKCVFSGLEATSPLVRTHLPLFSGESVINFRPNGTTWVPVAGPFIVAIFFLPMASRRSEGKLLCVYPEEDELLLRFARHNLDHNKRLISLALPTSKALIHSGYDRELPSWDAGKKRYKYADAKGPRSLVISDLFEIATRTSGFESESSPVTAYLLSNSGQGPSLETFELPGGVVSFVLQAGSSVSTRMAWANIARRFRPVKAPSADGDESPVGKRRKAAEASPPGRPGWSKNSAFEDLCTIYESGFTDRQAARRWISRHVLGRIQVDRVGSSLEETNARSWALADLFLKEVLTMKAARVDAIRAFADKLAAWIEAKNDRKLYRSLVMEKHSRVRQELLRVQRESAVGGTALFGLDEYATVWLHEDGDEWLVRDLLTIRTIESLADSGYLQAHKEILPEELAPEEEVIQ